MKSLGFKICYILSIISSTVFAGETGHYVNGSEGIKGASLPPPGFYYLMYNAFYNADDLMDADGDNLDIDFEANIYAMVNRFVWMSNHKVLGANYGMNAVFPLVNTKLKAPNVDAEQFSLSDIYFGPLLLRWDKARYALSLGTGVYLPTADHTEPAAPGKDFWTAMFTLGGTYYFDKHKTWSGSILTRYEIHSEKDSVNVKPGNNFNLEWGIAKTVLPGFDLGVSGYAQWQITDDSGSDVTWDKNVHDQVFAIGPEAKWFIPSIKSLIAFRSQWEFDAKDHSEGHLVCLTFIKAF